MTMAWRCARSGSRFTVAWLRLAGAVAALATGACSSGGSDSAAVSALPPPPPAPPAQPVFVDVTATSGIVFTAGYQGTMSNDEVALILPSGVAAGDVDDDGRVDLFIVRGDIGPNLLYRNLGNLQFEEIADAAGVAFTKSPTSNYRHGSPALADLDGDGDVDLLLPGLDSDPTMVFVNDGSGTFSDVSAGSGLDAMTSEFSFSPALGDFDLDGDLDLLLGHWGTPRDFLNPGDTEHLWRNDSDASGIRFSSISASAGISTPFITSSDPLITQRNFDTAFTPTFARVDDDAYPDILLVADFNFSHVFTNDGDGTFTNSTDFAVITDGNGMGSAVGDYDADGDLDWFVSSILARGDDVPDMLSLIGNRLYRNDMGSFNDVTSSAGVADGGWGWGSCFADLDNDGHLDIYQTNGWPGFDVHGPFSTDTTRVFMSDGNGAFAEEAGRLGLADSEEGRGVICSDFDDDGDVDLLLLHRNTGNSATLWENTTNDSANYLRVELLGLPPNTAGVGARITVSAGGRDQTRDVLLGSNFASHNDTVQSFGLGDVTFVDNVSVDWPAGERSIVTGVAANQRLEIVHPQR